MSWGEEVEGMPCRSDTAKSTVICAVLRHFVDCGERPPRARGGGGWDADGKRAGQRGDTAVSAEVGAVYVGGTAGDQWGVSGRAHGGGGVRVAG